MSPTQIKSLSGTAVINGFVRVTQIRARTRVHSIIKRPVSRPLSPSTSLFENPSSVFIIPRREPMDFHNIQSQYFGGLADIVTCDPIPDQHQLYDLSVDWSLFAYGPVTPPPFDLGELHDNEPGTTPGESFFNTCSVPMGDRGDKFEVEPYNEAIEQPLEQNATVSSTYGLVTPPLEVGELDTDDIHAVAALPVLDTDPNRFLYNDYVEQDIPFDATSPAYGLWTPPPDPQLDPPPLDDLSDLFDITPSDGRIEQPLEQMPFNLAFPDLYNQYTPPIECGPLDDLFSDYGKIEHLKQPVQGAEEALGLSLENTQIPQEQPAYESMAYPPLQRQERYCFTGASSKPRLAILDAEFPNATKNAGSFPAMTFAGAIQCAPTGIDERRLTGIRLSPRPENRAGRARENKTQPDRKRNTSTSHRRKHDDLLFKEEIIRKNFRFVPYTEPDKITSSNAIVVEHYTPRTTMSQRAPKSEVVSPPPPPTASTEREGREGNKKKRSRDSPSPDGQEEQARKKLKRGLRTPAATLSLAPQSNLAGSSSSPPAPSQSKGSSRSQTRWSDPSNGTAIASNNARRPRIHEMAPVNSPHKPVKWSGMILNCNGKPGKKNEWRHYS
ncbi:hypothetical protein BDZ97DRAFT_1815687 [Flammula alnicola]|nr:hypothetical protein BDZ97DRAFT_1815687 [Flammula alnicola]